MLIAANSDQRDPIMLLHQDVTTSKPQSFLGNRCDAEFIEAIYTAFPPSMMERAMTPGDLYDARHR